MKLRSLIVAAMSLALVALGTGIANAGILSAKPIW
jgi:hypothetical protein